MAKFIAYEKLSKKEQKKLNAEKRKTWGDIKPITKVKPSAKLYNRKKKQDLTSYSKLNPVFVLKRLTSPADTLPKLPMPERSLQNLSHKFDQYSLLQLQIYDGTLHEHECY